MVDLPPRQPPTCPDHQAVAAAAVEASARVARSRMAWCFALVFQGLLLAWLVWAAWGENEDYRRMAFGEGLWTIGIFAGMAAPFVVTAALVFANGRKALSVIGATVLLFIAGFVGFVGGVLILLTRSDVGDH